MVDDFEIIMFTFVFFFFVVESKNNYSSWFEFVLHYWYRDSRQYNGSKEASKLKTKVV